MNPNTPRTNAVCQSIRKDGIDWHHSATHMAGFARTLELEAAENSMITIKLIEEIYAVATGETQVGHYDTDGLAWIASRCKEELAQAKTVKRLRETFEAMEGEAREEYADYIKRCGGIPISKVKP